MTPEVRRGRAIVIACIILLAGLFVLLAVRTIWTDRWWMGLAKLLLDCVFAYELWHGSDSARKVARFLLAFTGLVCLLIAAIAPWDTAVIVGPTGLLLMAAAYGLHTRSVREFQRYRRTPWLFAKNEDEPPA